MCRRFAGVCVVLILAGAASVTGQQADRGSQVVAQVGDRVITLEELDAAWTQGDPAEHVRVEQELYEGRRNALDQLLAGFLVEEAARERGVSSDEYVKDQIAQRLRPVSRADVEAFYNKNAAQLDGKPLTDMETDIRGLLEQQARTAAGDALLADLRKAGPAINVTLEAPRYTIDVNTHDPIRGAPSAPVTIVEFSDYQCPFCAQVAPTLGRLRATYGERIRIIWKDFPLTDIHPQALKAAEAAHCAGEQGQYWQYHDRLFTSQQALDLPSLKEHAVALGLDSGVFDACVEEGRYAQRVRDGMNAGRLVGVGSTPTVFINGRMIAGAVPYETFSRAVEDALARIESR